MAQITYCIKEPFSKAKKKLVTGVALIYIFTNSFNVLLYKAVDSQVFVLQSRWGVVHDKLLQKGFPLSVSGGSPPTHAHLLVSKCPPPEEKRLSMPETGEKERNYLFKSYTNLE